MGSTMAPAGQRSSRLELPQAYCPSAPARPSRRADPGRAGAQGNPDIRRWMAENGVGDIRALLDMFEGRVLDLAAAAGRATIVWQAWPPSAAAARQECEPLAVLFVGHCSAANARPEGCRLTY